LLCERDAIEALLATAGITDELLAQRISEGLDATIVLRKTKYSPREVVVDFRARREMAELILQFKGYLTDRHAVMFQGPTLAELLTESYGD
jgi:hypothetical protein